MFSSVVHTYVQMNDPDLLHLLVQGDEAAYSALYRRYWKKLFSAAFNKLNNLAESEEVVQDIFLDLWCRRDKIQITSSFSAYLAMAVKYKVIDRFAKRARQLHHRQEVAYLSASGDSSTQHWLDYEELRDRLGKSIVELPEKCRLVFELSRSAGLSQKQIAARMGIAEKTVESHLTKALRMLRLSLGSFLSMLIYFILYQK